MGAIYRRELQGYFYTPTGYVFMGVFLALGSVFFGAGNLAERSGNMMILLRNMGYLWMLLSPVLTMRLLAGERGKHTDQLLFSSPCSLSGIVAGKFFAAFTVMLLTVFLTALYPILVAIFGTLYVPETLVGYLGFIIQGGCFIALDMLVSTAAHNQITAVIFAFGVNLFVWLMDALAAALQGTWIAEALGYISLYQRFTPFAQGQLSFANILYGILFMFVMLFLCVRILDARRWSEV